MFEDSQVVLDVNGIAYCMTVSANTLSDVSSKSFNGEDNITLYTHLSVREDGIELFGFHSLEELNMFRLLITVSGIGPKAGMSILSFMTPDSIALAICTEDKRSISKAPGIGPKTAARIILELKDKIKSSAVPAQSSDATRFEVPHASSKYSEAVDALTVLGFHRSSADEVLRSMDMANMELEDIIREALKKLMK